MKKRIFAIALVFVLLVSSLCACGKKNDILTQNEAVKKVAEHLDINTNDMEDVYVHITEGETNPCYSFHFTYDGKSYSLMVDVVTGEVMESDH